MTAINGDQRIRYDVAPPVAEGPCVEDPSNPGGAPKDFLRVVMDRECARRAQNVHES
jgi:hypothetical protein